MATKDKRLAQMRMDGRSYSIRATAHALQRMALRNVDEYVVAGSVIALGPARIEALRSAGEDAAIVDERTNTAVVITIERNTIKVVTVMDKCNVWVKSGTRIERIG